MLKLEFVNRPRDPIWVVDKNFGIGGSDDNQLVIEDPSISAEHARIIRQSNGYLLKDNGSKAGTYVMGRRVNQKQLHNRDRIQLGDVELEVIDPFKDTLLTASGHWSLVACSGWLAGREFPLGHPADKRTIIVGRGKDCDLNFPGTHLAKAHVEITLETHHIKVRDLGSAQGTFVNDHMVRDAELKPGDKLRLDIHSFQLLGPTASNTAEHSAVGDKEANEDTWNTVVDELPMPRRWVEKPTSPGNRQEPTEASDNLVMKLIAAALLVSALVAAVYLIRF